RRKSHDEEAARAVVGIQVAKSIERYRDLGWLRLCNSLVRDQGLTRLLQHRLRRFEFFAQSLEQQQRASGSGKRSRFELGFRPARVVFDPRPRSHASGAGGPAGLRVDEEVLEKRRKPGKRARL